MKAFRFLKDKWFYISLVIMLLLVVGAFEYTFRYLERFTRHGEEFEVPDMIGMTYEDAVIHYGDKLTFIVQDSVYVKDFPEGAVFQQNPSPGSMVKQGRNMYIVRTTISPEMVQMPNLKNLSLRQAIVSLNSAGLRVDKLVYVDYFARNAVVEQKQNGIAVEPDSEVVKGSGITLEVGLGRGHHNTNLPDLIGVSISEVKQQINNASLNIGTEVFIDDDKLENLYVSRMDPEYSRDLTVPLGSTVNVWYRSIENFDFTWYRYEKFRRDSIVEVMRLRKYKQDTIDYIIDSFNYILKNRTFSYDSIQRELDKQMMFMDWNTSLDTLLLDTTNYFEYDYDDIDTNFFYDE